MPGEVKQNSSFCGAFTGPLNHPEMDRTKLPHPAREAASPAVPYRCQAALRAQISGETLLYLARPTGGTRQADEHQSASSAPSSSLGSSTFCRHGLRMHSQHHEVLQGGPGAVRMPLVCESKSGLEQPVTPAACQR